MSRPPVLLVLAAAALLGCSTTTARLPADQLAVLEAEGIVRRLDDAEVRHTSGFGTAQQSWKDQRVSIVVTGSRVLIHENGAALLEITPRSTGDYAVRREGGRLSLRAGSGQSARSWAFHPPDDVEGWAHDVRAVIQATAGVRRRAGD